MVGRKSLCVFTFRFWTGWFIRFAFPFSIFCQLVLLIDDIINMLAESCCVLLRLLLLKLQLMLAKFQKFDVLIDFAQQPRVVVLRIKREQILKIRTGIFNHFSAKNHNYQPKYSLSIHTSESFLAESLGIRKGGARVEMGRAAGKESGRRSASTTSRLCGVCGGESNEDEAANGGVEGGDADEVADGCRPPTSTGGAGVDAELAAERLGGCCKDARCCAAIC